MSKLVINASNNYGEEKDIDGVVSGIEDADIKKNLIRFIEDVAVSAQTAKYKQKIIRKIEGEEAMQKILNLSGDENTKYVKEFAKYISRIESSDVKDRIMDVLKALSF